MALDLTPFQLKIESLCREFGVLSLELFGSALTDEFKPETSDADFLVVFDPNKPASAFRQYMPLKFALEDMLGRSVDLVEKKAIRNPYFLRNATSRTKLIYAA